MPNHVDQDLWVTGPTEALKEFLEFAKEGEAILSANKFIPYPEKYMVMDKEAEVSRKKDPPDYSVKDGFNSGGYEWCVQNWGTKWGIYDAAMIGSKLEGKTGHLKFRFNSAWSPPTPVILAMSEKFHSLHFKLKYYESGMQYQGIYIAQANQVLEESDGAYKGGRGG